MSEEAITALSSPHRALVQDLFMVIFVCNVIGSMQCIRIMYIIQLPLYKPLQWIHFNPHIPTPSQLSPHIIYICIHTVAG